MRFHVEFDMSEVQRWADDLVNDKVERAKQRAINKSTEQGRTAMVRAITSEYNITATKVRSALHVVRARVVGRRYVMEAHLFAVGKRGVNLINFMEKPVTAAQIKKRIKAGEGGTYQLRNGATMNKALQLRFKIKRVGAKVVIPGAFLGNKGKTVFIREGKDRLPIKALSTLDIPQMFNARTVNEAVLRKIKEVLPHNMVHEIKFALGRV